MTRPLLPPSRQVRRPPRAAFGRLWRDRRGATAIEFAFLLPFFLFFVFAVLEIAFLFVGDLMLDNAVDTVGRQVRTGEINTADLTPAQFRERICAEIPMLIECANLDIDLRSYSTYGSMSPRAPPPGSQHMDATGPDQIMALRVYYAWPLLTGFVTQAVGGTGTYWLAGVAAFRTEPF